VALFASVFRWWVLAVLAPHALLMAAWYCRKDAHHPGTPQIISNLPFAYVSVFAFIPRCRSLVETSPDYTRIRYAVFYVLFYSENIAMGLLWCFYTPYDGTWLHTWGLVLVLGALPVHIGLLMFYYACCHPQSPHIRSKRPGPCPGHLEAVESRTSGHRSIALCLTQ
jgi:hypothetical protein